MVMANKVNKELLEERIGYVIQPIAIGSAQGGKLKQLEWCAHPIMKEAYWMVSDGGEYVMKFEDWNDAAAAYNKL